MRKKEREFYAFKLVSENVQPSIEGRLYPNAYSLTPIDEIYDEKEETKRVIRYIPGEKSIYLDEQNDQDLSRKRPRIMFMNGQLIVDKRQKQLLEFLRKSNSNKGNKERMPGSKSIFIELIPGQESREFIKEGKRKHEAIQSVYNLKLDEMIAYARVLGVDVNRDPDDVRYYLTVLAGEDPEGFIKGLGSSTTKRKHVLLQAMDAGIISCVKGDLSVRWAKTNQSICQASSGEDPLDFMVDFTFESEGEKVYARIRELLSPPKEDSEKDNTEQSDENDYISMSGKELFNIALEKELITTRPVGIYVFQDKDIAKGKDNSAKSIDENEALKRALVVALEG